MTTLSTQRPNLNPAERNVPERVKPRRAATLPAISLTSHGRARRTQSS